MVKWQTWEIVPLKIGFQPIFLGVSFHCAGAFEVCVGRTGC